MADVKPVPETHAEEGAGAKDGDEITAEELEKVAGGTGPTIAGFKVAETEPEQRHIGNVKYANITLKRG